MYQSCIIWRYAEKTTCFNNNQRTYMEQRGKTIPKLKLKRKQTSQPRTLEKGTNWWTDEAWENLTIEIVHWWTKIVWNWHVWSWRTRWQQNMSKTNDDTSKKTIEKGTRKSRNSGTPERHMREVIPLKQNRTFNSTIPRYKYLLITKEIR